MLASSLLPFHSKKSYDGASKTSWTFIEGIVNDALTDHGTVKSE